MTTSNNEVIRMARDRVFRYSDSSSSLKALSPVAPAVWLDIVLVEEVGGFAVGPSVGIVSSLVMSSGKKVDY